MCYFCVAASFSIPDITFSQRCEHKCKRIYIMLPHRGRVNEIDIGVREGEKGRGERERETEREREEQTH